MIISISVSVLRANLAASSAVYMRAVRPKDFGLRLIVLEEVLISL